jgi:hypothetical protein
MEKIVNWLDFESLGDKRNLLKRTCGSLGGTSGCMNNPMYMNIRGTGEYTRGKTRTHKRHMEREYQKELKKLGYKPKKKKNYGFGFGYE